jgi:hypothetical protein
MSRCLTDESLERLARDSAPWWRRFLWQRHLRGCPGCQARWQALRADEQLLAELRQAVAAAPRPSPLSAVRGSGGPPEGGGHRGPASGKQDFGEDRHGH